MDLSGVPVDFQFSAPVAQTSAAQTLAAQFPAAQFPTAQFPTAQFSAAQTLQPVPPLFVPSPAAFLTPVDAFSVPLYVPKVARSKPRTRQQSSPDDVLELIRHNKITTGKNFKLRYKWFRHKKYTNLTEWDLELKLTADGGVQFYGPYTGEQDPRDEHKLLGPSTSLHAAWKELVHKFVPQDGPKPSRTGWDLVYYIDPVTHKEYRMDSLKKTLKPPEP